MAHDLDDVLAQAVAWKRAGRGVALATVVRTWGSSPRPAGSRLAVDDAGEFVGSVSGGCIEGAVITEALEVIAGGPRRTIDYGVSDEAAWEVGLACGGKVDVLIEALDLPFVEELIAARTAKRQVAVLTDLTSGGHRIAASSESVQIGDALRLDTATVVDGVFIEPHNPPLRLIIVGAVHVAEPLAKIAALSNFAVTIVDPRKAWATPARFPEQALVVEWPDTAIGKLAPDSRTAIVTLSHDPKLDDPALIAALASPAFYIGCLGSKKTHAARLDRLAAQPGLDRLHGPVGLAIGAKSPAEIAISIFAQIIEELRT